MKKLSKPKCKKCGKVFKNVVSVFLDSNNYEFYCMNDFSNMIKVNPFYLNQIVSIKYKNYLD